MKIKKEHRRIHPLRILRGIIFFLLVLTCSVAIVLLLGSEMLANQYLADYVARKSKNQYYLQFTDLDIDYIGRNISVKNIVLENDPSTDSIATEKAVLFRTSQLYISKIKLWPLLIDRRFMARSMTIASPEFKSAKHEKMDLEVLSDKQLFPGDTLELPFLSEIFFDSLTLLNAQIEMGQLPGGGQALQKINMVARHFKLGGIKFTDTPYPFDVSDLLLTLDHLNEVLPDSIHRLSIDQISLSLLHHNIKAFEVKLEPLSDFLKTNKVTYRLNVPEIELKSNNIDQLQLLDTLHIAQMTFRKPDIDIGFGTSTRLGTPLNEINFYDLTGDKIKWIRIDQFNVQEAAVRLTPAGSNEASQHFSNVNIRFDDFYIDSSAYLDETRILSSANLTLGVGQYLLYHNDKVHKLVIDSLQLDTRKQKVSTASVAFVPVHPEQKSTITRISAIGSNLHCEAVDLHRMYHHRQLPMNRLFVNEPRIQVNFRQKQNIQRKKTDSSLVLDKISDYLTGVYVDETEISGGLIRLNYFDSNRNEGFFKAGFDIHLIELSIDSATFEQSDKLFFAEDFDVGFNELTLQLADETHQLTTGSIMLSSSGKKAEIKELLVQPREQQHLTDSLLFAEKAERFQIRFPSISFKGANLHRAFFDKRLYIEQMSIASPVLNIEKYGEWKTNNQARTPYQKALYALVEDYLFSIDIGNVSMENGLLNIMQHKEDEPAFKMSNQFSINMRHFQLDEESSERPHKLFFSDEIDLVLKNHDFTLADGVHKITTREIGILSSEKRIYIKQAKLYPDILSDAFKQMPVTLFADIPEIQFTRADIFGFFNKGDFPVDQVIISRPDMKILLQKTNEKRAEAHNDNQFSLFNEFKTFTANRISIDEGKLELAAYVNFKSQPIFNTRINFSLDQFQAAQKGGQFETTYHDFRFDLQKLVINTGDDSHQMQLESANYRLSSENLSLKNFQLKPKKQGNNTARMLEVDLVIPEIKLSGFDARNLEKNRKIWLKQTTINNPVLTLSDNRIESREKFSPYRLNLYRHIQPFLKSFSTDELTMNGANIVLNGKQKRQFNNLGIKAQNILIDEANSHEGQLLYADAFEANLQNLKGQTRGGYFEYSINKLNINNKGEFSLHGFNLLPLMSEQEFARKKIYQADYFNIKNMNASGNGLDLNELIENNNFYMNELLVDFEEVNIHRDKNFPLTPNLKTKLPQQALRELKHGLEIKRAALSVDYFQFSELEPGADHKSMVFVTEATAELQNVTNRKASLDKQANMKGLIKGKLMGIGDAEVQLDMNIPSFGNEFTCKAYCGSMPLSALNPIAEPGLKISIREGVNQKMEVYFEANEDSAVGNIRFAYNDLRVGVLSKRDGAIREDRLISFLVNSIALKTDNPKPGRILLPARFTNHRDKQRSVVGYCWKSIYAGMKATLGIKEKEE